MRCFKKKIEANLEESSIISLKELEKQYYIKSVHTSNDFEVLAFISSLNPSIRNRLNGLYMTIFFLGGAFGSWIGSYSYYQFSPEAALLFAIAFPLLALFVHIWKGRGTLTKAIG